MDGGGSSDQQRAADARDGVNAGWRAVLEANWDGLILGFGIGCGAWDHVSTNLTLVAPCLVR
jgi:hypothetical protein